MKSKSSKTKYTHSVWSGEKYDHAPTVDELTKEGKEVLQRNPAIARAMSREAYDQFIAAYKAQHGIT